MDFTLAPATVQIIEALANAVGIALTLIVVALGLASIGVTFIQTRM